MGIYFLKSYIQMSLSFAPNFPGKDEKDDDYERTNENFSRKKWCTKTSSFLHKSSDVLDQDFCLSLTH